MRGQSMQNQSMQNQSMQEISGGLGGPTGSATGLPGSAYADPAAFERERETIFRQSWFGACYASDIPNPGDMLPVTVAGWELLLVRSRDNEIRCFHNICRHRGMKLLDVSASGTQIRCRYHCWTYGLDGALVGTPHIGGPDIHQADGIDRGALGLRQVRCGTWRDLVFVDIGGRAEPLEQHFAPLNRLFADYDLDSLRLAPESMPEQEIPYNWKIQVEGGIESYHLPWVHPQLEMPPPGYRFEADDADTYIGLKTPMSEAEMRRRSAAGSGAGSGAAIPTPPNFPYIDAKLARGETPQFLIMFVLPNVTAVVMPNYFILILLRPLAENRTAVRRKFYYIGEAATSRELSGIRGDIAKIWHDILAQDVPFLADIQKMCRVRDSIGLATRFSPYWEVGLHLFQKYVLRATSAPAGR